MAFAGRKCRYSGLCKEGSAIYVGLITLSHTIGKHWFRYILCMLAYLNTICIDSMLTLAVAWARTSGPPTMSKVS